MELWARESLLCQVVRCLCWSDQRALGDYRQCVRKCDLRLPELIYRREMELRYWRVDVHIPRSNLETIAAERLKQARLTWGSERAFEEGSGAKHLHTAEERRHDVQLPAVTCPENAREQLQKSRRGTESVCSGQRGVVVGDTSRAASDFGSARAAASRRGGALGPVEEARLHCCSELCSPSCQVSCRTTFTFTRTTCIHYLDSSPVAPIFSTSHTFCD